jgi:arginyl-tRNA synthetase
VVCVPLEGMLNRQGEQAKMIVQKSGGGFLYATTDLAAVRHRTDVEKAMRIIYCTDPGQSLHFEQVFQIARRAGWGTGASLEHVPFGLVMGEDGQKLKTRSGETPKLIDLLDTAVILANAKMLKMYRDELAKEGGVQDASRKEWLEARVQVRLVIESRWSQFASECQRL